MPKKHNKLSNNQWRWRWIAISACIIMALIASQYVGKVAHELAVYSLPDVHKIYEAEQKQFSTYTVYASKNWATNSDGTILTYAVELQSDRLATQSEMTKAGQIACDTGLPTGTRVQVAARKQFNVLFIPLFFRTFIVGQCPSFASTLAPPPSSAVGSNAEDCRTSNLSLTYTSDEQGSMNNRRELVLTNKGTQPCRISGHLKVSLHDAQGSILGKDAVSSGTGVYPPLLTLQPGKAAYSEVKYYDEDHCTIKATSLRAMIPGETTLALVAPANHPYCDGLSVSALHE